MNNNILRNKHEYDDIINLPHHVSKKHAQMSLESRSAQFAPFAAVTGYEEAVNETARITQQKIELDEEVKEELSKKILALKENINIKPKVSIKYFEPDKFKNGGEYITIIGNVKKIDEYNNVIVLEKEKSILIKDIVKIEYK